MAERGHHGEARNGLEQIYRTYPGGVIGTGGGEQSHRRDPNISIHSVPPKIDFSSFKVPILVATSWMPLLLSMRWWLKKGPPGLTYLCCSCSTAHVLRFFFCRIAAHFMVKSCFIVMLKVNQHLQSFIPVADKLLNSHPLSVFPPSYDLNSFKSEWVNRSTLRWFGHIEGMENGETVKKLYLSSVEGPNRRGKPLGRWEDMVKEFVSERGVRGNGLEWTRRDCMDKDRWRSVCHGHLLGG